MHTRLSEKYILEVVDSAIEATLEKKTFSGSSFFKKDLGFTSLDLIDFFFELERSLGTKLNLHKIFLPSGERGRSAGDLPVSQLVTYLQNIDGKQ